MPKRTDPYTGPFPRKRHSHRCTGCERAYGQYNAVACYKTKCTRAQLTDRCPGCSRYLDQLAKTEVPNGPK